MSDYVNNPMSKGIGDMVKAGKGLDTPLKLNANVLPNLNDRPSINASTNAADLYKGVSGFAPGIGRVPVLPMEVYKSLGIEPSPDGFKTEDKGVDLSMLNSENVHKFISSKPDKDKAEDDSAFGANAQPLLQHVDNTAKVAYSRQTNIDHDAYQDYVGGFGVNINVDIDEVRAQNQSGLEQAGHGIVRFTGTTAQAFVEPFVNLGGLFAWGANGFNKFSTVFDNEVTRGMDDFNDMLRESMPIYETKAQRESTAFSGENLTSGAFWFDRVLNGAAFTVGTLLNSMATAGIGNYIKGLATTARLSQQVGKAYGVMAGMDKAEDVANALRSITNTGKVGAALTAAGNVGKGAAKWGVSLLSASAEGGVEAREMKRELMPILQAKVDSGELTQAQASDQLETAMTKLYMANVAIVGASNHMQYAGLIFRGGRASAKASNLGFREILKDGIKGRTVVPGGAFTRMLLNKAGEATRLSKTVAALTYGMPLVKGIATESFEEGSQFVASKAMIDYYSLNGSRSMLETVTGTWDSVGVGYDELMDKKEGKESMLIGGMMGLVGGGRGLIEQKRSVKRDNEIASYYNNKVYGKDGQMTKAMAHIGEVIIANQASVNHEKYKGKAKDDAVLEALDNHHTASMAQYGVETGTLDLQKEYLDDIALMDNEEFAVNFPTLASMTKEERSLMVNSAKDALDKNAKTYNDIKRDFSHLDDDLRNSVYFLASFHGNTQDIYNKKIDYLKQQGIDIAQARAEALSEYESERSDAYAKYKEAQKEKGGAYKSYVAFSKEYDEAQEIEVPVRTIKDGKAVVEKTIAKGNKAMILAKRTNEIADTYFQREDGKILNESLYNDFADTVQLEKSLNQTQAMIADYHNTKKVEELTKVYNDSLSKTAKETVERTVGKSHSTTLSKLRKANNKSKKEDLDITFDEAAKLQSTLNDEMAKRIAIINTPNVDEKQEKVATLELETLMSYSSILAKELNNAKTKSKYNAAPAQPAQPAENPTILTQDEAKTKEEEDIRLMNENYERHGAAILNSVGNALKALGDKIKQQFPSNVPNDIQNEYEASEHQYNTILVKAEEFKTKMKPDTHSDIDVFNATFKDVRSDIDNLNISILNLTSKVDKAVNVIESIGIEKYIVELENKYNELLVYATQCYDLFIDLAVREGLNDTIEARIKELEHNIAKLDELINTGIAKLDTKKAEAKIDKITKAIVEDLNLINGHLNELSNLAKVESKEKTVDPIKPSINSNPTSTPTTVEEEKEEIEEQQNVELIDPVVVAEEIKSTSDITTGINVLPEIADHIEGDTTQDKINNVFSMLQGLIDSDSDTVSFSVRASDNTTTTKPLTKHQLLDVLFGDGTANNKGLFYNHLIEKGHNSKSLNAIYSNPLNFMAEVESLWSKHSKSKLNNGYFNVFLSQFMLINSNRFNNVPIITFKEFRQFIDTDGVPYITADINTKAKDLNQDLENKDTERKAKDPAVLVRANRDTRENNEILERIVDIEEVYTGAAAQVEVSNMTMTVNGKTITTDSVVKAIQEGRLDEIPIEVVDSLPLNALNSKGEIIGYLNTASDLRDNKNDIQKHIAGFKNVDNPNAAKEGAAAELRIATLAYEIERARDLRLKVLFYLALNPNTKTIPTTIVHRGTGYSETTPNALYVSDAIKQEGTVMLVAKPNKLDMITSLYMDNDTPFAGRIHNLNHTTQLVNGITYIAFPVNKVTNSDGKLVTEYMIMPMQSTLIGNSKQGFMNEDNRQGVDEDGKQVSPSKSGQVVEKKKNGNTVIDNSNTFGEQVKHSIVTAVKMLMKLKKNEAFNEIETQFKEALSGKFNMDSEEGVQDYINQLTYTYNNDPVEFTYAEGNRITVLDLLKKDRIKEGNVSIIRASQNYIEFGTRKNGVVSVVSFYMGEEGIKMSSYDVNTTTDNVKVYNSVYENDDAISQFVYDHLDTAFLRVDLNNLNKKGKYELPLVKLGYADKASTTKDDNTVALIQPIKVVGVDPKGISFDSYEEYARNILRSDIKSAYINGKYYYSAMPAVMIDDKSIDADIRNKQVNGKTFEDFKASFKSNNATVILNSRYNHTDIANASQPNANPENNSFVALLNAIKVRLAIDFDSVTTNHKGEIVITKGDEVTRIYMGNIEKRYIIGKNSKVDNKKVNKIVEDLVRELNKPFSGDERFIGLYSNTVKIDSPIETKAASPATPTAGSTQTDPVVKTEVEINTIDAGVRDSLTGEQLAIFASIDALIGNPAIESAIPLFVNRLLSLDKNNLTQEDYAGVVRDYIARKTMAITDGNSTGTFAIRVLNPTAVENEASKRQDVLDAISTSPAFVRDNEGKIAYNTFKTLNRAQSVADRLNERLQETPFYAKVIDISTKNFQNVYQVVIGDESDVFDLFGEDHVDLVKAINNNKGFIPFVSPVVQVNTIRNIGNIVFDRLLENKNKKGTLSEVIEEQVARWNKKIEDLSSIKETLSLMGSDSQLVDNFDREITMYRSLIDNKKVLADMVTTDLMSDNMISFKTKDGNIVAKESEAFLSKGESEESDVNQNEEDIDEDDEDFNDRVLNDELEEDDKESNNWDDGNLNVDHRNTASVIIKQFLRGLKMVRFNSKGEAVVVTDPSGADMIVGYKDAYSLIMKYLMDKPRSFEQMLSVLREHVNEQPVFQQIIERLENESRDPYSTIPNMFVELAQKRRLEMKYLWLSSAHKGNGSYYNKIGDSNKANIKNVVMNQWQNQLIYSKFVTIRDDGSVIINSEALLKHQVDHKIAGVPIKKLLVATGNAKATVESVNKAINAFNKEYQDKDNKWFKPVSNIKANEEIAAVGIAISNQIKDYIESYTAPTGITFSIDTINSLIRTTANSRNVQGVFELFLKRDANHFKLLIEKIAGLGVDIDLASANLHAYVKSQISIFLKQESMFNVGVSPDTFKDRDNKTVNTIAMFKYIDERLIRLTDSSNPLLSELRQTAFAKKSWFLDYIKSVVDSNSAIEDHRKVQSENQTEEGGLSFNETTKLKIHTADSIVYQDSKGKTVSIKVDKAERGDVELFNLFNYYNKGNDTGVFMYPALSDGKLMQLIEMTKFKPVFQGDSDNIALSEADYNRLFEYIVEPEIDRIVTATKLIEKGVLPAVDQLKEGSQRFILNPYLDGLLDGKNGRIKPNRSDLIKKAKPLFKEFVESSINDRLNIWHQYGIAKGNFMNYQDNASVKDKTPKVTSNAKRTAIEFEINNLLVYIGVNQAFVGDTGAYWSKNLENTISNISKRLAGHRGPGAIGANYATNETFSVVVANDIHVDSEAINFIPDAFKKDYGKTKMTTTDGQEFTSLYEDLYTRMQHGDNIPPVLFNLLFGGENSIMYKAYTRMFVNGEEDFNYDAIIEAELAKHDKLNPTKPSVKAMYNKFVNQPVKPMYYNTKVVTVGNTKIDIPFYIKSSSFALRPSLTQGFGIDAIRKTMDYSTFLYMQESIEIEKKNPVDKEAQIAKAKEKMISRYSHASAIKVGCTSNADKVDLLELDNGKEGFKKNLATFEASKVVYPREGFRIQQVIPFDYNKQKINVGTQERKLLFNGFLDIEDLRTLKTDYDAAYDKLYKTGYDQLMSELTKEDGELDYNKLSNILIKEGLSRKYDDNDIAELLVNSKGDGLESKLFFHRRDKAIESLILSIVNNRVNKMKFPGRSYVLGTEAGFFDRLGKGKGTKIKDEIPVGANIIFTSKWKGELKAHGFIAKVQINENIGVGDYIPHDMVETLDSSMYEYQPDQVILPNFIRNDKGKLINLREGFDGVKGKYIYLDQTTGTIRLDESKLDTDILRLFGFRIPTQGHSSMASMEVVGFSDDRVGELVIAPADFVARMGSDFDIDKLYVYRYAISMKDGKYSKNNEDKYGTINEIIDIHHKVFAHPSAKVQKSITSPLSYGFFNQSYQPADSVSAKFDKLKAGRSNYYLGEFIEDLYGNNKQVESPLTSKYQVDFYFKGKMGKDGIAMFSSRSVINAVLQQATFKNKAIQLFVKGEKGMIPYTTKIGGAEFKNENLGSNETLNKKGFTIADVISWYQSTAVDNAKLNKLHKMNINSETIDVVNLMNQIGFEEETIWFINQPIIRRYAELIKNQQALIAKSDNGKKTALDIVKEEFHADTIIGKKKVSLSDNPMYNGYKESVANMADNIEKYSKMKDVKGSLTAEQNRYFGEQLAILSEFNYMKTQPAAHFKNMAQLLNIDSKGLGSSVANVYKKKQLIASFLGIALGNKSNTKATIADYFSNIDSILGTVKTNEEVQDMIKNNEDVSDYIEVLTGIFVKPEGVVGNAIVRNVHAFDKLFGKEFIQFSDVFEDAKSELIKTASGANQSYDIEDTVISEKIITAYKKYAHANALASLGINLEDEYNRLLVDEWRTEKGENPGEFVRINEKASIATVIIDIQKTKHSNNTLIASITAQPSKGKTYASVLFNNLDGGSDNNAKVLAAMYDLINSNPVLLEQHPVTKQPYTGRDLIKDLFIYSEITGGIQRFGELVKFMPHELKKMIGFNESLNNVIENKPINNKAFLFQFIQHEHSFARKLVLDKGEKGIINLTKIDRVENEVNGKTHVAYMPVNYNGAGSIGYLMIHPSFKENKFFKVNDEPYIPLIVSKKYTKDGVTNVSLFKLVLNGDGHAKHVGANEMIDNSAASPLMIDGFYVYERVDELGTGTKTEYDPTLSIVGTKQSATNKEVRSNYHTAEELLDATYDKSGKNTDFIFRNYSPRAIGNALQKAANNTNLNPVARFFAATLKNNNFHNGVVVMSRAELLSKDTTDNPTLETAKKVAMSAGGISNPMYYQENTSKDINDDRHYIIVNEDVENSAGTSVEIVLKDFIHEMIHAATIGHIVKPLQGEPFKAFEENGNKLVKSAVDYLRKNPTPEMKEEGMTIDEIIEGFGLMVNSSNSVARNEFFGKWGNYYGLLNFKEFYSEIGSNAVFIEMMGKIPYTESLADSHVIRAAKGHSMIGDNIVAAFIKYAAKLINDLLYLFYKTTGSPLIKLKESSLASYAVAELVVGIKTYSKAKLGREYKLYNDSKGQPVPNTVDESDFVANKSLKDKIQTLKTDNATADALSYHSGIFDNNGEQDVYEKESEAVTNTTVVDGEIVELASTDDVNSMFEEIAGQSSSFSIPSSSSILGDIFERVADNENAIASEDNGSIDNDRVNSNKVDEILLGLNKEGRLDFSCKL